jgi:hypothetical protein
MNDSKDLNEKKEGVVDTTPKVDNNSSEAEKPKEENNILSGEIVSMILDKEVTVKFSNNERGTLPYDKFKEKPMVGDIVKVRLEDKNGSMAITEIISLEKPQKGSDISNEDNGVEEVEEETASAKEEDEIELAYLNKDFVLETMSVPTDSHNEFRMVAYIMMFARRNGIQYDFDEYGNVYLTKGTLEEGEYYPCVTSHLDTVQHKQEPYIRAGVNLDLKIEKTKDNEHKVSVDTHGQTSIGIGADDKGGVTICLSMFEHFEKLKACFFLCEEIGCLGSKELDKDWFKDVGYCIGYDSPDLFRAAWSCSGIKLFSYAFYEKYMKPVCDEWGLKDCFYSEPITDVMEIRKQTGVMCMNFGNGGYNAHQESEYCILEHMDHACGMGIALIDHIGLTRHYLKHTSSTWGNSKGTYKMKDGLYYRTDVDDTKQLESLGDSKRFGNRTSYSTTTTKPNVSKDEQLNFEVVKYIVNRYDSHINATKTEVLDVVKKVCEDNNIDFKLFEAVISEKFNNDIKF